MSDILASSVVRLPHIKVFDEIIEERLAAMEIEKPLLLLIDNADPEALYWLFSQFDLLGFRGWKNVSTDEQKRAVLKQAIALKRYAGTPYGLKQALRVVGFENTVLIEHVGDLYDGDEEHDGDTTHSSGANWANFILVLDIGMEFGINDDLTEQLTNLINEYKNARSHLNGIRWKATMKESAAPTESIEMTIFFNPDFFDTIILQNPLNERNQEDALHNSRYTHNGQGNDYSYAVGVETVDVEQFS